MKYSTILLLLGVVSASKITKRTPVKGVTFVQDGEDDDDAESEDDNLVQLKWTEPWGPGEDGIVDALTPPLA